MSQCQECIDYGPAYTEPYANVNMIYVMDVVFVIHNARAICKKCGFLVHAKLDLHLSTIYPHSSLNSVVVTYNIPEISYSVSKAPKHCIDLGHIIHARINNINCIVYFDVPIDIDAKCHMTNFQLEDGRVVLMCVNRNGDNIFIDEHGELVPYNAIPEVSPNTYENDKFCVKFNGCEFEFTNKIAGAKTKAASFSKSF